MEIYGICSQPEYHFNKRNVRENSELIRALITDFPSMRHPDVPFAARRLSPIIANMRVGGQTVAQRGVEVNLFACYFSSGESRALEEPKIH
jgi:hypothetical protein